MKNDVKKTGVYGIINIINLKMYIGSTQDSFEKRWWLHKWELNNSKHKNTHLQNAWLKYGEKNFIFTILEITDVDILKKEQVWIDSYKYDSLYNINKRATGYAQFDEETIRKRSNSIKKVFEERSFKYRKWLSNELEDADLTESELSNFIKWKNHIPWNKGKKYKTTEHLKVPHKKSDRTKDIETKRNKAPVILIFDEHNNFLKEFRCSKDIEEWSITDENDLPINSRFKTNRRSKSVKFLSSSGINKSCNTGKPYKGLFFKYKS